MKKTIFIILGLTVGLLTGLLVFSLNYFSAAKKTEVAKMVEPTVTPVVEKTTWDDQSGFTFDYPKNLNLNPHDEDKDNYAHVELTSATHSGSLIVWAKDTTATTLDGLMKQKKVTNAIDSTLGGEPAKKYITDGEARTITTSALYNGYLYETDINLTDGQDKYWDQVGNEINSSFKFKPQDTSSDTGTTTNQDYGGDQDSGGGDEVIE